MLHLDPLPPVSPRALLWRWVPPPTPRPTRADAGASAHRCRRCRRGRRRSRRDADAEVRAARAASVRASVRRCGASGVWLEAGPWPAPSGLLLPLAELATRVAFAIGFRLFDLRARGPHTEFLLFRFCYRCVDPQDYIGKSGRNLRAKIAKKKNQNGKS